METLLQPVILDYFSLFRFPAESVILQVVGEKSIPHPSGDITRTVIRWVLSDGKYCFNQILTKGTPTGKHSLIRVIPSKKNNIIVMWDDNYRENFGKFISLLDWVKILDGKHTSGRLGNPIEIINIDM